MTFLHSFRCLSLLLVLLALLSTLCLSAPSVGVAAEETEHQQQQQQHKEDAAAPDTEAPGGKNKKEKKTRLTAADELPAAEFPHLRERVAREAREAAAAEATREKYESVRADFRCRACAALASLYFEVSLPALEGRYAPQREGVPRPRMVADVHDAVDGLCVALAARQRHVASGRSPSGALDSIQEGTQIACNATLEELGDALAEHSFTYLLPHVFPRPDADAATAARGDYTLPRAGALCEELKLCSPFLHYHITAGDAVERARAAANKGGEPAAPEAEPGTERKGSGGTAEAAEETPLGDDEDLTVAQALRAALTVDMWRGLPWDYILSRDQLRMLWRMANEEAVHFQFWAQVPRAARIAAPAALAVVALVAAASCCCCHRRPSGPRGKAPRAKGTDGNRETHSVSSATATAAQPQLPGVRQRRAPRVD